MAIQQGWSQQTPAVQSFLRGAMGTMKRAAKRTVKRAAKRAAKRAVKRASGGKLKFGSPAWQKKYKVGKFAKKRT